MTPPLLYFSRAISFLVGLLLLPGCLLPSAKAQSPFFGTAVSVGNTNGMGLSSARGTAADAQGNSYVTGVFSGRLQFGSLTLTSLGGSQDVYVAKYDVAGNLLWAISVPGNSQDNVMGLVLDASGNVYITGQYSAQITFGSYSLPTSQGNGDVFVAKLSPSGKWLWAAHAGGSGDDHGYALAVDASGNATVSGEFGGTTATFGTVQLTNSSTTAGSSDIFVARLSSAGTWLAATATGGPSHDSATHVALDAAGNAYVCGNYSGTIKFGTTTLSGTGQNSYGVFVAKITPAGHWEWAATAGGTDAEQATGLGLDKAGNVYVTGSYTSPSMAFGPFSLSNQGPAPTMDTYVAALDASGTWRWAIRAGGPGSDYSCGLAVTDANEILIAGGFTGATATFGSITLANTSTTSTSYLDSYVAKLTTQGIWQWALGTTGSGEEEATAFALAPDGTAYVAGLYWESPSFGSTTLQATSIMTNVFIATVHDQGLLASLTTVAPGSGAPGQVVTLTGSGFVGVQDVLFNGTPAASFKVQSVTSLEATVPADATAGPVSVRTSAGLAASAAVVFQPTTVTAAARPASGTLGLYPNPASTMVYIPGLAAGSRVQLLDVLGHSVRTATLTAAAEVSVSGLAPGLYTLRASDSKGQQYVSRLVVQ